MFGKAMLPLAASISPKAEEKIKTIQEMKLAKKPEKEIVKACKEFWGDFGEAMIKKINMVNDATVFLSEDPNVKALKKKVEGVAAQHKVTPENCDNDIYNADHSFLLMAG